MRGMGIQSAVLVTPASYTNGATATGVIDTLEYDRVSIDVAFSTANTTTNQPDIAILAESDDATTYTSITGFRVDGTNTDFTIPAAVTEGDYAWKFNLDLRGRKRYIKLSVSPNTTQVIAAVANLYVGDEAPIAAGGEMKLLVEG